MQEQSLSKQIIVSSFACHRFDPDCRVCSKPIYWQPKIFFEQRMWHLKCFRCCRCRRSLKKVDQADETSYNQNNKEKFDKFDSKSIDFNPNQPPTSCLAILGEDMALRCLACDQQFELKKRIKRPFQRRGQLWNSSLISTTQQPIIQHYDQTHVHPLIDDHQDRIEDLFYDYDHHHHHHHSSCSGAGDLIESVNKKSARRRTTKRFDDHFHRQSTAKAIDQLSNTSTRCTCTGCQLFVKQHF